MILKEFDESKKAIINPEDLNIPIDNFPDTFVSCFARETFMRMVNKYNAEQIASTSIANMVIPIYRISINGKNIGLINSYVGAPGCVGTLEDLVPMGMRNLVLFGTCGVLDEIDDIAIILPNCAIRDEGTSYHYAPFSNEIEVNRNTLFDTKDFLNKNKIKYHEGKVWTTDAIYRETVKKMERRKKSGCIAVDMECSAVAAWAQFREINVLHFFYAADKLSTEGWDKRLLSNSDGLDKKDVVSDLAIELALNIF